MGLHGLLWTHPFSGFLLMAALIPFTRRSLAALRRATAGHPVLASLDVVTAGDGSTASSLIFADMAGGLDRERYRNAWVMCTQSTDPTSAANVGVVRRVGQNALTTVNGALAPSLAFPSVPHTGDEFEVHRILPPRRMEGRPGINDMVNLALREMWFPDRIAVVGVAGQPSYDIFTANQWADPESVIELYGPQWDTTQNRVPWPSWGLTRDADTSMLEVWPLLGDTDTVQVQFTRPGDTLAKLAGVWTAVDNGLVNDTDETLFQPQTVTQVALALTLEALSHGDNGASWVDRATAQRKRANGTKLLWLWHPEQRNSHTPGGYGQQAHRKSFWGTTG